MDFLFDLINSQFKLIHDLVKTDVQPKDKQNFPSCVKISSDDVLSSLEDISGSYATRVYIRLVRSIILAYIEGNTPTMDRIYHSWLAVFVCWLWWTWSQLVGMKQISTEHDDKDKKFFSLLKLLIILLK